MLTTLGRRPLGRRPLGGSAPSAPRPIDLAAAVEGRLYVGPVRAGLATWAGVDLAPPGTALPYLSIQPDDNESSRPSDTAGGFIARGLLGLASFGADRLAAYTLAELAEAALAEAPPLSFRAGRLMVLRRTGRTLGLDPDPAPDGGDCWMELRLYEYQYSY
jgi:hypothetical protein